MRNSYGVGLRDSGGVGDDVLGSEGNLAAGGAVAHALALVVHAVEKYEILMMSRSNIYTIKRSFARRRKETLPT